MKNSYFIEKVKIMNDQNENDSDADPKSIIHVTDKNLLLENSKTDSLDSVTSSIVDSYIKTAIISTPKLAPKFPQVAVVIALYLNFLA